ncbi:MAG: ADP-forming succinate--CoA ligase subunit beta [Bacteroidia bacterium]|nr:ADP-forming succinate--CoA ligase subunit beta [Bacteroidia bacterium]
MKLHEYQAKDVISKFGVPIQRGMVASSPQEAESAARQIYPDPAGKGVVIKAQIHAGGRGKGTVKETGSRGVVFASSIDKVREKAAAILGGTLVTIQTGPEGRKVNKVLVAEDVYYPGPTEPKEYYFSITLDRERSRDVIIASTEGGMDIEEVAEHHPEKIIKEWVDPVVGFRAFQARKIAFQLGFAGDALSSAIQFMVAIYKAYRESDADMLEINPMLKTSDNRVIAVDCKFSVDDNALFRHLDLAAMNDETEEDPMDLEAKHYDLNFVKLDGNVGCMVNGAGLAMATMDVIKLSGGEPANFLDVGGTADAKRVENAMRLILKDPNVKAILINIFGGIVRCDRVANGVVEAYKNIGEINVPIIVRLQGTNAELAAQIIDESGLKVTSAITLAEAAEKVRAALA